MITVTLKNGKKIIEKKSYDELRDKESHKLAIDRALVDFDVISMRKSSFQTLTLSQDGRVIKRVW